MSPHASLALGCLLAAAALPAQVFVTNTSNLIAYYNFETNIANQVAGGLHNGTYQVSVTDGIAGDGAGFAGSAAYAGYNNNGGAESTTDRSRLLVGNALNIADNGTDGLNNGSGHFYVSTLTSNGTTAVNSTTATLGQSFTIGTWFFVARDADNPANRDHVFEARDNVDISWGNTGAGGNSFLSYVGGTAANSVILEQGRWHQTVHSFSSSSGTTTLSTYVNGVLIGTQTTATTNMIFSGINFGHARTSNGRIFDGMLDEVTAWKSALSAHDAYIGYNLGLAGVATNASIALRTKSDDTTALSQSGAWGGTAPAAGDLLLVDSTYAQAGAVDLGGNVAVRGLRVTTGTGLVDITASAGTLSVGALGIDMFAAARDLRLASLTASADQRWNVASGRTLTVGAVAGAGGVTKLGSGSLVLGGGSIGGTFDASAGSVTFGAGAGALALGGLAGSVNLALQDSAATPAAVALTVGSNNANTTYSGVLSGSGSLTKSGAGTLALSGANTHSGATTVTAGTLNLAAQSALGSSTLTLSGGAVAFDAVVSGNAFTVGALAGSSNLALANNAGSPAAVALTTGGNNASTTYSGVLSGSGSLAKSGTGTLTLSGANTHSGGTTLTGGALLIGHASALGNGGTLSLNGGTLASSSSSARTVTQAVSVGGDVTLGQASGGTGVLQFSGAVDLAGGTRTVTAVSNVIVRGNLSNGSLVKAGDGTLVIGGTPSLDALTVTAGRTLVTGSAGLGNAVVTLAGGELRLQGPGDLAGGLVLGGSAAGNRLSLGLEIDYLVVGGGGGGAGRDSSGGGGGGGVLSNLLLAGGAPVLLTPGTLSVNVGAGGAGEANLSATGRASNGGFSSFGSIVALGGGGGGAYATSGASGASGGGSGRESTISPAGTPGQGYAGGRGSGGSSSTVDTGGGGGGAGEAGQGGVASSKGGDGGDGLAVSITGSGVYYGGGGGGSPHRGSSLISGLGGLGGGGNAAVNSTSYAQAGVANTGGGGGASRSATSGAGLDTGGAGGSGLVVIRYLGDAVATGGTITTGTGAATGYTFHTFASVGESQFAFVGDRRVAGVISGTGGFTFDTPGYRLTLDSTNTYSGGTVVEGGTLVANAAGALGTGAVNVTSGGILQAAVAGSLGSTTVNLGTGARLDVQAVGAISSAAVTAGSGSIVGFRTDGLTLAQMTTEAAAVTWQTGSLLALDTSGGDFTLDEEFQPSAALAKTGSNNLVLAVVDSARNGSLAVTEGGVRFAADNSLGSAALILRSGTSLAAATTAARTSGGSLALEGDISLGDAVTNGGLALTGSVDLGGSARTLSVLSDVTLAGVVSNGSLTKTGPGALTVSGNNTFAGGLTLVSGALRLGSDNALGTGPLVLSGGAISSDSSTARAGTTAATYGGNLTFGDAVANGALTFSGAVDLGGAARTLNVLSATTLSGVVSNGALVKTGAGTLTLSGATTFTGNLTVSEGTLAVTGSNSNGSATVRVQTGGTLDLRGGLGLFRTGAFQGGQGTTHVFVDAGTLVVDRFEYGDGGNLNQLRNNLYSLRLSNAARIRHTASEQFLRAVTIGAGGAVFETDAGVTITKLAGSNNSQNLIGFSANSSLTFAGAGTYIMQDALGTSNYSGATNNGFSLAKQDAGTLRLTGANAYTGGTSVTGGLLEFASGSLGSSGAISVNGGGLRWLSGNTQDISSRLSLGASGATLDVAAGTVNLATGIAAAGDLTKAGAGRLDLGSATTVAGLLSVNAGTLSVSSLGALGSGAVTLGSGAVLRLALGLTDGTVLANSFVGGADTILDIDHGNELLALGFGGLGNFAGRLRLTSGLVDLTGYTGGVIFAGGSVAGDLSELTIPVEVGSGAILNAANGLPAQVILGSGGTLDFFGAEGDALNRVILLAGGALANAEQFAGTLRIQGSVSLGNALLGGSSLATVEVRAGSTATIQAGFDGAIRFMGGQIDGLANYLGTMTVDGSLGSVQINLGTSALPLSLIASFNLTSGGRLAGTGIVGDLTVASGGVLAPGNSPGSIEAGNLSLLAGGGAEFEFLATDPAGVELVAGEDFDVVRAFDLDLSALSSSQRFHLDLISLSGLTTGGTIAGWDSSLEQSWDIYEYLSLTLGASQEQFRGGNLTSLFLIDSSAFLDEVGQSIASNRFTLTDTGASIRLTYSPIPEPSTYGLLLGGLALAAAAVRRRRIR